MKREDHIEYLMLRSVETTPGGLPQEVIEALPDIFARILDKTKRWAAGEDVEDYPVALRVCAC